MVTLSILLALTICVGAIVLAFIGIIAIPLLDIAIAIACIWLFVTLISFIGGVIFGAKKTKEKKNGEGP